MSSTSNTYLSFIVSPTIDFNDLAPNNYHLVGLTPIKTVITKIDHKKYHTVDQVLIVFKKN